MVETPFDRAVHPPSPTFKAGDAQGSDALLFCSYRNTTDRMVVVRVRGIAEFFCERVVFPFEVMTFHCPRDCEVEVIMRTPKGDEQSECLAAEHLVAGEHVASSEDTWRPARNVRSLSVRSNASAICQDFP